MPEVPGVTKVTRVTKVPKVTRVTKMPGVSKGTVTFKLTPSIHGIIFVKQSLIKS